MKYQGRIATALLLSAVLFYVTSEFLACAIALVVGSIVAGYRREDWH
jgi:hypothetical protein